MAKKFNSQEAIRLLREKGLNNYVCPCCGGREFSVHNEAATISVTDELKTLKLGNHIPAAILVCIRCGNMQFFALGTLGMLKGLNGEEK